MRSPSSSSEQVEVELRRARLDVEPAEREAGQGERGRRGGMQAEHHLEDRVVAERALRLQLFDQPLERQVLVRERVERRRLHARDELAERRPAVELHAQDDGVGEEADEPFDIGPGAVRDGRSDREVGLPGPPMEQRRVGGEHRHERRRVERARHLAHAAARGRARARRAARRRGRSAPAGAADRSAARSPGRRRASIARTRSRAPERRPSTHRAATPRNPRTGPATAPDRRPVPRSAPHRPPTAPAPARPSTSRPR